MKIWILCAVIIVLLTNDTRADEKINEDNLITTYDPGEATSESPNFPRLPDDQPDHHAENQGHIRFERQTPERPVKFEDDTKEHGYDDIDKADPSSLLADISFDNEESFDKNDRISNTGTYNSESNSAENKIKFEDSNDEQENSDDQDSNDEGLIEDDPQSGGNQVVFKDDGKAGENDSDYSDESEIEAETSDKPIKFENQDSESNSNNRDSDRNTVTERVVFKDDSNQNQQPVQKKKRKPKRKPRFEAKQTNSAPTAPNSPYPGLGYPGYPGVGYPGPGYRGPGDPNVGYPGYPMPGYPGPGDPNAGYPGYPTPGYPGPGDPNAGYPGYPTPGYPGPGDPNAGYPGYPMPGYPGPGDPNAGYPGYPTPGYPTPGYPYPNYPSPYPGMALPTSAYPGFSPYPNMYPPMAQGYGGYPAPGYQTPGNQRPSANLTAYPTSGQGDPSGHTDTRYPNQDYGGSPSPVATPPTAPQNGQPGHPYPGPEYPYYQGYPVPGYPPPYPSDPNAQYPPQNQAQHRPPVYPGAHQPGYASGNQRPSRRPKSLTQRAVAAVAEALTSIALYDDQQCVPRILCEVAGGSTASSPTLLKASASLQPLLSLLQAYNGISTSPLFIFGRATVTGITAKGNPSTCYRAYPQCPSDPEKLINYLNNHNGGFFRFFGQPDTSQQPHNLEQFYNYLSGQNDSPQQPQQNYGFPRPYGYGFPPQNPYAHPYSYGHNYYNERIGYRNAKNIDSEVQARIQNKPGVNVIEAESDSNSDESQNTASKWSFPGEGNTKGNERDKVKAKQPKRPRQPERQQQPDRGSKTLKFPDDRSDDRREIQMLRDYPRKEKHIFFPRESNFQKYTNYYQTTTPVNPEEYYFDHKHNFYVKRPKALKTDDVVYVVRGNGDPNHPEVVRVKPGQSI